MLWGAEKLVPVEYWCPYGTCNLKKFDVNCCETVNVRPNLSENEILIYYNVVGNRKAFLLSSNLKRNTEVHKILTQICICGTVLMVAVSASLTDGGNLSHFNLKSHIYSVQLRWILPTLYCKQNVPSVGNETKWESWRNIFPSLPVLHITFKWGRQQFWKWNYFLLGGAAVTSKSDLYQFRFYMVHISTYKDAQGACIIITPALAPAT